MTLDEALAELAEHGKGKFRINATGEVRDEHDRCPLNFLCDMHGCHSFSNGRVFGMATFLNIPYLEMLSLVSAADDDYDNMRHRLLEILGLEEASASPTPPS